MEMPLANIYKWSYTKNLHLWTESHLCTGARSPTYTCLHHLPVSSNHQFRYMNYFIEIDHQRNIHVVTFEVGSNNCVSLIDQLQLLSFNLSKPFSTVCLPFLFFFYRNKMPPILFLCDSLFSRRPNPLKLLPFFPNIELLTSFSLALLDNRLVSFCKCFVNIIFNNSSGKPIFTKCLGAYLTVYFCLGRSTRSEEQFLKTAFVGGREKREKAKERVTKQVTERERERWGYARVL